MSEKSPHSDSVPGAQWRRSPSSAILPLSALVKCVPYFFLGSLTPLSTLPHSLSLCHTAALSLSRALSLLHSLSASLSPCLSLALLLLHTDRVVKGARPRLRAEQTALLLLQPSWWEGLEQICARERSRHRPAGCSVSTTWENAGNRSGDERGWRQREQSIPPTGYTRSYRLEYCVFTRMLSLPNLSRLNSKTSYVQ